MSVQHIPNVDSSKQTAYAVITPVRNEAEFIEKTIQSMINQTVKPVAWVIVNDGSTDETAEIIGRYLNRHPWIKLVNLDDRGIRQRGKGVVEAFYAGYQTLTHPYDFIVKLDGDLSFEPAYFETIINRFLANPQLGIGGGSVYEKLDGIHWTRDSTQDHVRGPTKVYRKTCFDEIGGLMPALGWDGIDEWIARSRGWEVQSFLDLQVLHYRVTGAATGALKSKVEQGYGAHYMGYHPLFIIARGIRYMAKPPYLIGGLAMIYGFFFARLRGLERYSDKQVIRYVRRTQLKQLAGLFNGQPVHQ